ncbi:MAG: hypothetical protein HC916_13175 [Coleofasciculaceae cyanobacterium SM2_1_6]|nr:hypothetical protein [Coleofasciculaceae cyanobacterium SM2_1_6]
MKLPNFESAFIDRNKLWNYSLNPDHDRGKHKSRLFAAILGLSSNDAEILQALILEAILNYEATPSLLDEYGQRYTVDFPVTRNQNTATVRTTWIIRPTENFPRLTSCYILR